MHISDVKNICMGTLLFCFILTDFVFYHSYRGGGTAFPSRLSFVVPVGSHPSGDCSVIRTRNAMDHSDLKIHTAQVI
jgi:hypothetical protein